jgi:hypothetical protein
LAKTADYTTCAACSPLTDAGTDNCNKAEKLRLGAGIALKVNEPQSSSRFPEINAAVRDIGRTIRRPVWQ